MSRRLSAILLAGGLLLGVLLPRSVAQGVLGGIFRGAARAEAGALARAESRAVTSSVAGSYGVRAGTWASGGYVRSASSGVTIAEQVAAHGQGSFARAHIGSTVTTVRLSSGGAAGLTVRAESRMTAPPANILRGGGTWAARTSSRPLTKSVAQSAGVVATRNQGSLARANIGSAGAISRPSHQVNPTDRVHMSGGLNTRMTTQPVRVGSTMRPPAVPKEGAIGGRGAGARFTSNRVKSEARAQSNHHCVFCWRRTTREPGSAQSHIDHAIPKSRGGNNSLSNAQNTCRTCNLHKGSRATREYTTELEKGYVTTSAKPSH